MELLNGYSFKDHMDFHMDSLALVTRILFTIFPSVRFYIPVVVRANI